MKLAIVGSRDFNDYETLCSEVASFLAQFPNDPIECIVSGGARGADALAERYAAEHALEMLVFKPDWKKEGRRAGILRNTDIVEVCTHMAAFPSHAGRGTQDSIRKAERAGKPVHTYYVD